VRPVEAPDAEATLRDVLAAAPEGARVVHSCARDIPIGLLRAAGADAISLDANLLDVGHYDLIGEAVDAGVSLWLGVLPIAGARLDAGRHQIESLWSQLGFARSELAAKVVATPVCGLAGASPEQARQVLTVLRDLGKWLTDEQ
jgi:hypothetical protein